MTTTQAVTFTLETRLAIAEGSAKVLSRWLRKWDRWQAAVNEYSAGRADYPSLRRMPSRESGKSIYGTAGHIQRCLPEIDQTRAQTVDGLRSVLASYETFKASVR